MVIRNLYNFICYDYFESDILILFQCNTLTKQLTQCIAAKTSHSHDLESARESIHQLQVCRQYNVENYIFVILGSNDDVVNELRKSVKYYVRSFVWNTGQVIEKGWRNRDIKERKGRLEIIYTTAFYWRGSGLRPLNSVLYFGRNLILDPRPYS